MMGCLEPNAQQLFEVTREEGVCMFLWKDRIDMRKYSDEAKCRVSFPTVTSPPKTEF